MNSGNQVTFIWPDNGWKLVTDIQYRNNKTKGWSGEFGDAEFNNENKIKVDLFLNSVFQSGWSSKDLYLFGRHYKSITFSNRNFKGRKFTYWSSNYGCLFIIAFPVFIIFELLLNVGLLGRIERINIEPINLQK